MNGITQGLAVRAPVWLTGGLLLMVLTPLAVAQEHGHEVNTPFAGTKLLDAVVAVVIFAVLIILLGRFAWGPLLKALQNRERLIEESLIKARQDRKDAEARLKEYTDRLDHAREEASAIVNEGKRDAEAVKRRIEAQAQAEAEAIIARARREIDIARDDAIKALYEHTAELATIVAGRIIRKQLTPEDHRALVSEAIEQIQSMSKEDSSN
jgi:F-type H+-transporting ATPase subunit b